MHLEPPPELSSLPPLTQPFFDKVERTVSPNDQMFFGNAHHYLSCGASALNVILATLRISGNPFPASVLDFGSGAGRVTRWLRAAFPGASLACCDLAGVDLDFCRRVFHAETWVSGTEIASLQAPGRYDLIWLGSVATHLPGPRTLEMLEKMRLWTNPGGLILMSLHGRFAFERPGKDGFQYIHSEGWKTIVEGYQRTGYGYADYESQSGYGISVTKLSWIAGEIEKRANLRLIALMEKAWDGHHDVVAVQAV